MNIQESGEMYLESVLLLSQRKSVVRSVDISEFMGYSRPSVSRAVRLLRENGYLSVQGNGALSLTEEGRRIAETIYERHTLLTRMLEKLGVDETTAVRDACRLEHVISPASFEAIKKYLESMEAERKS